MSLDDWLDVMEGGDDGDTPRIPLPMEKKIALKTVESIKTKTI